MIDTDAIRAELKRRNRIRRQAQLPPIDIKRGLDQARCAAKVKDYQAALSALDHLKPTLEAKWLARYRRRLGDPAYVLAGNTNSRWIVGLHVGRVLERILRVQTGRVPPDHGDDGGSTDGESDAG